MNADTVVTPEQWQEAERLFWSHSDDGGNAMTKEKYDTIVYLLFHWDEMSPQETRLQ